MRKYGACGLLALLLLAACTQAGDDKHAAQQTAPAPTTTTPNINTAIRAIATTAPPERRTSTPSATTTPQTPPVVTLAYARTVLPPTALSRLARRHLSSDPPTHRPRSTPTPSATPVPDTWRVAEWEGLRVPLPPGVALTIADAPFFERGYELERFPRVARSRITDNVHPYSDEMPCLHRFSIELGIVQFDGSLDEWIEQERAYARQIVNRRAYPEPRFQPDSVQPAILTGREARTFVVGAASTTPGRAYVLALTPGYLLKVHVHTEAGFEGYNLRFPYGTSVNGEDFSDPTGGKIVPLGGSSQIEATVRRVLDELAIVETRAYPVASEIPARPAPTPFPTPYGTPIPATREMIKLDGVQWTRPIPLEGYEWVVTNTLGVLWVRYPPYHKRRWSEFPVGDYEVYFTPLRPEGGALENGAQLMLTLPSSVRENAQQDIDELAAAGDRHFFVQTYSLTRGAVNGGPIQVYWIEPETGTVKLVIESGSKFYGDEDQEHGRDWTFESAGTSELGARSREVDYETGESRGLSWSCRIPLHVSDWRERPDGLVEFRFDYPEPGPLLTLDPATWRIRSEE